jgi:glycosyltransferase involved in cell wall biosynthesis
MSQFFLKVHHVMDHFFGFGGPSYTVPSLCAEQVARGDEVVLHLLKPRSGGAPPGIPTATYPSVRGLGWPGVSPPMRAALSRVVARGAEVLHSHGLWSFPTIYPSRAVRGSACRLVASPRGSLDPGALRHHGGRKRIAWALWQREALAAAHCLHATAPMEYDAFRAAGLTNPVAVVPNGQHIPPASPASAPPSGPRRLLFLARVHPKKGVDLLLHAWRAVQDRHPGWELHVVGPDDGGHLPALRALAERLGVRRATFHGEVPPPEKEAHYRAASLYVLPTHGENWGVSVAEALAYGVPAVVSRAAPWEGLVTYGCGWWIPNTAESLSASLHEAMSLPAAALRERGARGRAWVEREFGWGPVGERMRETYLWLARGAPRPEWVHD